LESAESLNDSVSAVCRDSICPVVSIWVLVVQDFVCKNGEKYKGSE
jgi:hypothetical protein